MHNNMNVGDSNTHLVLQLLLLNIALLSFFMLYLCPIKDLLTESSVEDLFSPSQKGYLCECLLFKVDYACLPSCTELRYSTNAFLLVGFNKM